MQFLAGLQIKPVDHADDGLRRSRMQRFQQDPHIVAALRRLHQDDAARIKSETVEAMSGQAAALARSVTRHRDNDFFVGRSFQEVAAQADQHRDDKTESGRERSLRCGDELMECAAAQTAIRQVGIKCGKPEWKAGSHGRRAPRLPGQEKAQFGQCRGAGLHRG